MADKKVDIFMPLYVGDYLADTSDLSAEEHGAYLLLMMGAWRREGRLPTDPTLLSRIAQVPKPRWAKVWAAVGRFFDLDDGTYVQRRLMAELDKVTGKKAAASAKGSKGANARWGHVASNAPGMPRALPEPSAGQCLTDGISESESGSSLSLASLGNPDPEGARSNGGAGFGDLLPSRPARRPVPAGLVSEAFLSVYDAYPRKDAKQKAAVTFAELAAETPGGETALAAEILEAFRMGMLRRHPYAGQNATRPILETVLAERRWRDPPSAPDNEPSSTRSSNYGRL